MSFRSFSIKFAIKFLNFTVYKFIKNILIHYFCYTRKANKLNDLMKLTLLTKCKRQIFVSNTDMLLSLKKLP